MFPFSQGSKFMMSDHCQLTKHRSSIKTASPPTRRRLLPLGLLAKVFALASYQQVSFNVQLMPR